MARIQDGMVLRRSGREGEWEFRTGPARTGLGWDFLFDDGATFLQTGVLVTPVERIKNRENQAAAEDNATKSVKACFSFRNIFPNADPNA
jgi:hypothetical protein